MLNVGFLNGGSSGHSFMTSKKRGNGVFFLIYKKAENLDLGMMLKSDFPIFLNSYEGMENKNF